MHFVKRSELLMDIRDMVVEIVYENKDGLFLLQIGEGVNKRFNTHITTRDVEQVVKKNPKLFVEENGKIKCPPTF
jgi:hypothetical protein